MKRAAIQPLSVVPRDAVTRYLVQQGHAPEVIAWKYFDERFNRGRERGMVWLQGGEVRGFLGLIPFRMHTPGGAIDTNWTCDWSVDSPQRNPGMGIILLRAAIDSCRVMFSIGGNQLTRSMMPRLAAQTIEDAGVVFVRPLRARYVLEKVDRRVRARAPWMPPVATTWLGSIKWPQRGGPPSRRSTILDGVAGELAGVLDDQPRGTASPLYDFEYVAWQIGRSPLMTAWTCLGSDAHASRAAVILYRLRHLPSHWRMVCWLDRGGRSEAEYLVRSGVQFALDHSAASMSALISREDDDAAAVLRAEGFAPERGGHPLYLSVASGASFGKLGGVRGLSYIDTDHAYTL